jgi:hypothetical protein
MEQNKCRSEVQSVAAATFRIGPRSLVTSLNINLPNLPRKQPATTRNVEHQMLPTPHPPSGRKTAPPYISLSVLSVFFSCVRHLHEHLHNVSYRQRITLSSNPLDSGSPLKFRHHNPHPRLSCLQSLPRRLPLRPHPPHHFHAPIMHSSLQTPFTLRRAS